MSDPSPAADIHARFVRAFPGIALTIFLSAVDQTIVATALPAIAADMGGIERVSWILVAYLVAATCAAPVFGQLGDVFGRRRLLFVALAVFAAGCLGCALAPNLPALIGARIVQGFGGGALLTLAQALIGEALPPRERGRYQAWIAGSFAFASACGPVIGGYATQFFGWRSVFLVLLPVAVACAVLARRLAVVPPARREARLRFDWAGLGLFVLAVGCALVALDRARRLDPALLPAVVVLAVVSVGAVLLLLRVERVARDPLLPLSLFAEPSIWRAYLLSACVVGAQVGMIALLPVWLQTVRGIAPGPSGLMLVAMSLGGASGAFFSGRMVARTGHAMRWPTAFLPVGVVLWGVLARGGGGPAADGLPAAAGGGGLLLGHVLSGGAGDGAGGGGAGEAGRGLGGGGVLAQHRRGDGHGAGGGGGVHGGERDRFRRGVPAAGGGGAGVSGRTRAGGGGGAARRIGGGVPRAVRDGGGADGGGGGAGVAGAAQAVLRLQFMHASSLRFRDIRKIDGIL